MIPLTEEDFMHLAIVEALAGIENNHGGPFGSIIVKDNEIIGRGHNKVLVNNDPTAHGEIEAIRDACKNLKTHDLKGSILYTTCYPCPMCACACMWANIDKVIYGCSQTDADAIGFRDAQFYEKITQIDGTLAEQSTYLKDCKCLFEMYVKSTIQRY